MDAKHREGSKCNVIAHVVLRGPQFVGIPRKAVLPGKLPVQVGDVMFLFEDRDALKCAAHALDLAMKMADAVFGPERDAFDEVEAVQRARFEKGLSNDIEPKGPA